MHDVFVVRRKCAHKEICKGTWIVSRTMETNQLDYVLINKRGFSSIKDVRSMQVPNCDSDRFLLRVKYRQKIMKIQDDKYEKRKKWNEE